ILSIEALVRWNHPWLGKVFPDEFIPIAEQTGVIIPLGNWIMKEALKENRRLRDKGIEVKMAVHVSPLQFEDENLLSLIEQELAAHELPPDSLIIEITESVMQNIHKTGKMIQELK